MIIIKYNAGLLSAKPTTVTKEMDSKDMFREFSKHRVNMEHMQPVLRADAIPTIFNKEAPKGSGQMKGKIAFKRNQFNSKFCSKFQGSLKSCQFLLSQKTEPKEKKIRC